VLSVEGANAGRLRQMRLHGGLHVQMFHGHDRKRVSSISHRLGQDRHPAQRFCARRPWSPASRTPASNSGLNGVTAPFATARP